MNRQKPKSYREPVWSAKLAYAVGLIVSDGSLSKDGRHIDITSSDRELLATIKECLDIPHVKIGTKFSGTKNKHYYRIQFSSVSLYYWLTTLGVWPNKSNTIESITIDDVYFFDFLRGVFDGDGTISVYTDRRWKNSQTVCLAFASGSIGFLTWLQKELEVRIDSTGSITRGTRVLQLKYGKKDARKIFNSMYYKKLVPKLERKFAKAEKILKIR